VKIEVVTASIDPNLTEKFWHTWMENSRSGRLGITHVINEEPVGVVPAFGEGIRQAVNLDRPPDIIACIHDDVAIYKEGWDDSVAHFFQTHPECVLLGFGGAFGVGHHLMYQEPYDPMSLARHRFVSNMKHAEAHGQRTVHPHQIAVLDGFSLIGRRDFMVTAWEKLESLGIIHHAYDVGVGCMARRMEKETWLLPLSCHHHGGMTAVANPKYKEWADKLAGGDGAIWHQAHKAIWTEYRDVLPFYIREESEEDA